MDFALMAADNGTPMAAEHQSAYNYTLLSADTKPGSGDPPGGDAVRTHRSMHPIKQERSGPPSPAAEENRRPSKAPTFFLRSASAASGVPGKPPTMLSFSSASEEIPFLSAAEDSPSAKSFCYPFLQAEQKRAAPHSGCGAARGWNDGSRGGFGRPNGPFTPPQWMELEHQALIYKHLVANVPIPSNLLIPITKALNPYSFSGITSASSNYASNCASNDPEPGRCRRTDGKKWRCSRDAVADQKYCERHINRGRHRSRKPVEGLTGRTVSGSAPPSSKVSPPAVAAAAAPTPPPAVVISCDNGGASNSFGALKHHTDHPDPLHLPTTNRGHGNVPVTYPSVSLKDTQEHNYPYKDMMGFGFVSSSSESGQYGDEQHGRPVRHFTDGWVTKEQQSTHGPVEPKPDWTQLSMSIPMARGSPPRQDQHSSNSSLRPVQKASTNGWIPVGSSWGNNVPHSSSSSMGGPLGEVLINSTYGSSPTGVLGGSTFVSRSNSSSGSSPPLGMR